MPNAIEPTSPRSLARVRSTRRSARFGAALATCAVLVLGVTACSTGSGDGAASASSSEVALPPAGAGFDYQLGGASAVPDGASVVARDSTDEPADGAYGICYVNGFQTQPGVDWPSDLLVRLPGGEPLVDPNWPDEHILDIATDPNRQAIAARLATSIDGCADAGYQAVEFDNLDSWTRSDGAFDEDDAVAYATLLVAEAHEVGLAAAQKNTADLGARGRDEIGYDFAITEECDLFDECDTFTDVYGALVFDVEYTDDLRGTAAEVCDRVAALDPAPTTIVRDRDLVPADDPAYAYTAC
ncbi:endo alpha-1,4 polygalactosaminidase [Frigoribacterium sp. CFBP9030]|uniref:endo alpha-1,4 polygalactosaminidase n=1 Tax=Frigoribacterium sp. CFBP9030 TaxID=3096537 RepID=UPI002A698CC0|nr:endo alpha-1,4 polygalactosaminidase [Frigoribacterium sp. CFBP9030]MDY0892185.1 endo alpha-1,4 polygalactosaminidase [Frigoribacterium sp. CFBP9030]